MSEMSWRRRKSNSATVIIFLDYDGICKHPHGHNAVAEIEVRTDTLNEATWSVDFSDIKRVVKGSIDAKLDHRVRSCARTTRW